MEAGSSRKLFDYEGDFNEKESGFIRLISEAGQFNQERKYHEDNNRKADFRVCHIFYIFKSYSNFIKCRGEFAEISLGKWCCHYERRTGSGTDTHTATRRHGGKLH